MLLSKPYSSLNMERLQHSICRKSCILYPQENRYSSQGKCGSEHMISILEMTVSDHLLSSKF